MQARVVAELDRNLGECPECRLSFCTLCRAAWHYPNPCKIDNFRKLVAEYIAASPEERLRLEKRFGKANMQRIYIKYQDEQYLQANTKVSLGARPPPAGCSLTRPRPRSPARRARRTCPRWTAATN